jgi:hypothetical protein
MVGPLYLSPVEFIKNRPFELYVPAFFHPHIPDDMKNPTLAPMERVNRFRMVPVRRKNTTPFRHVFDPHQRQRAAYPIEVMLEMFQKQIEFEHVYDEDVVEVFEGIDRYLVSLRDDVIAGSEKVITYVRFLLRFREEVYKHYYRYMMSNPTSLASLYPNNDTKKNIFALLSALSGTSKETFNLDPLRAKGIPPLDLNALMPKEKTEDKADGDLERSYGIGSGKAMVADDSRDFNFEDFLKKG